jgi:hypothetical protein
MTHAETLQQLIQEVYKHTPGALDDLRYSVIDDRDQDYFLSRTEEDVIATAKRIAALPESNVEGGVFSRDFDADGNFIERTKQVTVPNEIIQKVKGVV